MNLTLFRFLDSCFISFIFSFSFIANTQVIATPNIKSISNNNDPNFSPSIITNNMIERKNFSIDIFSKNLLQASFSSARGIVDLQQQLNALDLLIYRYSLFRQYKQIKEILDLQLEVVTNISLSLLSLVKFKN